MSTEVQAKENFGFINGLTIISTFLFPVIAIGFSLVFDAKVPSSLFIFFAISTRFLGDWFFWTKMLPQKTSSLKEILFSHPETVHAMMDLFMDLVQDVVLVYLAFKASASPAWVFFVMLGSQALSAPVKGIVSDRWSRKNFRVFSMIVSVIIVVTALGVCDIESLHPYVQLFGLHYFSSSVQMLILLGVKNFLSATTIISNARIADCIAIVEKE